MAKILLVEDDLHLVEALLDHLRSENHTVESVADGDSALELLELYPYDVIVLDIGIPKTDGFEVCKRYRAAGGASKIIILTGKTEIDDKETGFELGADDYLTKPFHTKELLSRIRALLRRTGSFVSDELTIGNLSLVPKKFLATKAGVKLQLTPKEFALLEFFMRNENFVFNSDAILDRVWHSDTEASTDIVKSYIHRIRDKIGNDPGTPQIVTMHGAGYMLKVPQ